MPGIKFRPNPVPGLQSVDHIPTSASASSPYLGGLTNIGDPGINAVRAAAQTAAMAKKNQMAPQAPAEAKSPISKIRVRRKKFRYAPAAPAGGFALPATKY